MTCLLDRETYRRWESYFNRNGLPMPAHYEMRDYTPAPLPDTRGRGRHKKPRQEPVMSNLDLDRLVKRGQRLKKRKKRRGRNGQGGNADRLGDLRAPVASCRAGAPTPRPHPHPEGMKDHTLVETWFRLLRGGVFAVCDGG